MGALAGLKGWSCAILGGIGSITGSLVGGIILGIVENLTAGFISTGYKDAIGFAVMILVLLIKPSGLMGYKFEEKFKEAAYEKRTFFRKKRTDCLPWSSSSGLTDLLY